MSYQRARVSCGICGQELDYEDNEGEIRYAALRHHLEWQHSFKGEFVAALTNEDLLKSFLPVQRETPTVVVIDEAQTITPEQSRSLAEIHLNETNRILEENQRIAETEAAGVEDDEAELNAIGNREIPHPRVSDFIFVPSRTVTEVKKKGGRPKKKPLLADDPNARVTQCLQDLQVKDTTES
jgi:hypothetical protein